MEGVLPQGKDRFRIGGLAQSRDHCFLKNLMTREPLAKKVHKLSRQRQKEQLAYEHFRTGRIEETVTLAAQGFVLITSSRSASPVLRVSIA